jgi:hypothetical protein
VRPILWCICCACVSFSRRGTVHHHVNVFNRLALPAPGGSTLHQAQLLHRHRPTLEHCVATGTCQRCISIHSTGVQILRVSKLQCITWGLPAAAAGHSRQAQLLRLCAAVALNHNCSSCSCPPFISSCWFWCWCSAGQIRCPPWGTVMYPATRGTGCCAAEPEPTHTCTHTDTLASIASLACHVNSTPALLHPVPQRA